MRNSQPIVGAEALSRELNACGIKGCSRSIYIWAAKEGHPINRHRSDGDRLVVTRAALRRIVAEMRPR